jgi:Flp pilus assembly protein TadD
MTMGRRAESLAAGRRALELDPMDLANNSHEGWYHFFTRDYARAVEPLQRTIDLDPTFHIGRWYLGIVYEQQRAFDAAIEQFEQSVRLTGDRPSMVALLGHAYAAANRRPQAENILRQLTARSTAQYVAPYPVAAIHVALGDVDEAFAWLERAYVGRDSWMDYIGLDPRLDALRSDSRFTALLQRLHLPAGPARAPNESGR